jgi:hypothetical protein
MDWNWLYGAALVGLNNLVLGFWKPWAKDYAGEKGKNFARKEDLDLILAEVRAVTATQKQIEARISNEVWQQQWRLTQLRDAYALLLDKLEEVTIVRQRVRNSDGLTPENRAAFEEKYFEYRQARVRASLFISTEHFQLTQKVIRELDKIDKNHNWAEAFKLGKAHITQVRDDILAAARKDLGLKEPVERSLAAVPQL